MRHLVVENAQLLGSSLDRTLMPTFQQMRGVHKRLSRPEAPQVLTFAL